MAFVAQIGFPFLSHYHQGYTAVNMITSQVQRACPYYCTITLNYNQIPGYNSLLTFQKVQQITLYLSRRCPVMVNNGGFSPPADMLMGSLKHHKLSRSSSKHQNSVPLSQEPILRAHLNNLFDQSLLINKDGDLYCPFSYHPHPPIFPWKWVTLIPFQSNERFYT